MDLTTHSKELRVTLLQYDIAWEDKSKNISYISTIVSQIGQQTDLVILPEMFSTGFSLNAESMAESTDGETICCLKKLALDYDIAICGSLIIKENTKHYNRAFFISPTHLHFYDKRHLFRMGQEAEIYTAGTKKTIIDYKGFSINLLICYDLRFPVWSRNVANEYDLLIYVANWPESRKMVWRTLLPARAIENMSFVCGVNRVGKDNMGLSHSGNSMLVNSRGQIVTELPDNIPHTATITINKDILINDRNHFPVWKDADNFDLKN